MAVAIALICALGWPVPAKAQVIERVSVASDGSQGNMDSYERPALSADGRYVAFLSLAANLVPGDTNGPNGHQDILVHDRLTGTTTRVSVASDGSQSNHSSYELSLSADGRYVAFSSLASNLVSGDTNGVRDVFLHDRLTGTTTCVAVASDGSQGNDSSYEPSLSADGRYVAFSSSASNLVSGDTNGTCDIFLHDRLNGLTTRVSVAAADVQATGGSAEPSLSADGRYVAFNSWATNLVSGDDNEGYDVFLRDRVTGTTTLVSVASDGSQGDQHYSCWPSVSANGRYVAFTSDATNLVPGDTHWREDIFLHDRLTGTTTRVSVASDGSQSNGRSSIPSLSADGRYVAFSSSASNLVPDDTNGSDDIFLHDRLTGTTTGVSVGPDDSQMSGTYGSSWPSLSADGRYVAFSSSASNLVPGDTNGSSDIFVAENIGSGTPSYPRIFTLTPNEGPSVGGNQIVLSGANFTGATEVRFGDTALSSSNWRVDNDRQITITSAPPGAVGDSVPVVVVGPGGSSAETYLLHSYSWYDARARLVREVERLRSLLLAEYDFALGDAADTYAIASIYRGLAWTEWPALVFKAGETAVGTVGQAVSLAEFGMPRFLNGEAVADAAALPRVLQGFSGVMSITGSGPYRALSFSTFAAGLVGDIGTYESYELYPQGLTTLSSKADAIRSATQDYRLFGEDLEAISYGMGYELARSPEMSVVLRGSRWTGARPDVAERVRTLQDARDQIAISLRDLEARIPAVLPAGFDTAAALARLGEVSDLLAYRGTHQVRFPAVRTGQGAAYLEDRTVNLGSVNARRGVMNGLMTAYQDTLSVRQTQVLKSWVGMEAGVFTMWAGGQGGVAELAGQVVDTVQLAGDLSGLAQGIRSEQTLRPLEAMNQNEFELLLALPQEVGRLWEVADGTTNYLDFLLGQFAPPGLSAANAGQGMVGLESATGAPGNALAAPTVTYTIAGTVRDATSGERLSGVVVGAIDPGTALGAWSLSAADGTYTLVGLAPGSYKLSTWNARTYHDQWYGGTPYVGNEEGTGITPLALVDQDLADVDFALSLGASVSGQVTGPEGVSVAGEVIALDATGTLRGGSRIAADGTYAIAPLTPGTYRLFTRTASGLVDRWYGGLPYLGDHSGTDASTIVLTDADRGGFDISLQTGTAITGRVRDTEDQALPGVLVVCVDGAGDIRGQATTGADGSYRITGLLPASYRVMTAAGGDWVDIWYGGSSVLIDPSGSSASLVGTTGGDAEGINLTLAVGRRVAGQVEDADTSGALRGVDLELCAMDGTVLEKTTSGFDGSFGFSGLPPNGYMLRTFNELGYEDEWFVGVSLADDPAGNSAQVMDLYPRDRTGLTVSLNRAWLRRATTTGWNLLAGGPGSDTDGRTLFGYTSGGYQSVIAQDLTSGQGYWCRYAQAWAAKLSTTSAPVTVSLILGWNLIGNPTAQTLTLPTGMTAFVFDGTSYRSTTTLLPGEGAWVKATLAGDVVLGAAG